MTNKSDQIVVGVVGTLMGDNMLHIYYNIVPSVPINDKNKNNLSTFLRGTVLTMLFTLQLIKTRP